MMIESSVSHAGMMRIAEKVVDAIDAERISSDDFRD